MLAVEVADIGAADRLGARLEARAARDAVDSADWELQPVPSTVSVAPAPLRQAGADPGALRRAQPLPAYVPAVFGKSALTMRKFEMSVVASMCRYTDASRKYFSMPTSSIAP